MTKIIPVFLIFAILFAVVFGADYLYSLSEDGTPVRLKSLKEVEDLQQKKVNMKNIAEKRVKINLPIETLKLKTKGWDLSSDFSIFTDSYIDSGGLYILSDAGEVFFIPHHASVDTINTLLGVPD